MKLKEYDLNNSLIVVPSIIKDKIIKEISSLDKIYNYKIISDNELKTNLLFDYNEDALLYIKQNYNVNLNIAKEYINAMYYIEEKDYNDNKLNLLKNIKNQLKTNRFLKKNDTFLNLIKNKNVLVYGFDYISKELEFLLKKLPNYTIINEDTIKHDYKVYKFETLDEEVNYVFYEISKLINNGVNVNSIKIANASKDYEFTLKKYSNFYNISIDFDYNSNVFSLIPVKNYFNKVSQNNAFDDLTELASLDDKIYNKVVGLINKSNNNIELLEYLLKNTNIPSLRHSNSVELVSLTNNQFEKDDYVFVLSINQTIYPRVYQDEDFLNDNQKEILNISTSVDSNKNEKEAFLKLLSKDTNLYLSYKLSSPFNNFAKAYILNDLDIQETTYVFDKELSFSKENDKICLATIFDEIYKEENNSYYALLNNTLDIPYKKYSNKFISFDAKKIQEYITNNKINLSYSALDNFYKCPFKYYLNNILKLSDFEATHYTNIGNVFHETLEHSDDEGFDFDTYYDSKFENITDKMTIFYVKKLKETLRNIVNINKENKKYTKLTNSLKEKEVNVFYDHPITIKFRGFVDKMMYMVEDDKTYVAIIDYKTGNPAIELDKVEFGLSLQLPIYLYLIKHTEEFKNVVICGFYLQKLLLDQPKALDPDPIASIANSIKYQGFSNEDKTIISKFDSSYEKSETIKSLRTNKDGNWGPYSKVISSSDMDKLANQVEDKIKEAIDKICNCDFVITDKYFNGKSVSCDYCEFKNCCFKQYDDRVYLDNIEEEKEDE